MSNLRFNVPDDVRPLIEEMQQGLPILNKPSEIIKLALLNLYSEFKKGELNIELISKTKQKTNGRAVLSEGKAAYKTNRNLRLELSSKDSEILAKTFELDDPTQDIYTENDGKPLNFRQ